MHHLLYPSSPPPADRHYLKLWSAFVGVSSSQNHRLPTNQLDTNGGTIYKQHSQNGWIYFETSAAASFVLERGVPQRLLAFGALIVDFPDPPLGVAYAAAPPVEWRGANVPRLSFPFAICNWRQVNVCDSMKTLCTLKYFQHYNFRKQLKWSSLIDDGLMIKQYKVGQVWSNGSLPGGVPQQSLLSSICSTSNPMNQEPNETSSFIYLCRICLVQFD